MFNLEEDKDMITLYIDKDYVSYFEITYKKIKGNYTSLIEDL